MKKILYFSTLLSVFVLYACNESFLERNPLGSLDETTYLNTDDAAMKLVTSCYQPMKAGFGYAINRVAIGSESTDDADGGGSDAGDRPQTTELGKGYPLSNNALLQECWSNRYLGIGRCNVAIEKLSNPENSFVSGGNPVSKEMISRYISEVKFLRVWYYFDLITTFKEIPLITEVQLPNARLDKTAIEEIKIQLYKDIDDAINDSNLPWKKNMDTSIELGRVSKDAAYILKARLALFFAGLIEQSKMDGSAKDEYIIAKNASYEVIEKGGLSLTDDFQDLYGGDYTIGLSSKETIFTVLSNYISEIGHVTDTYTTMNVGRNNVGGWGGNVPTTDLANSFDDNDPRKLFTLLSDGDIFPRAETEEVHNYKGYYNFSLLHNRKAFVPYNYRIGGSLSRSKWAPYWIRYAEAILIYAEALLKTGGSNSEVAQYINMIRYRAFVTTSKKDKFAVMRKFEETLRDINENQFSSEFAVKSTDDLMKIIKKERRAEFAMEGLRLYDLIRWGDYVNIMQSFHKNYDYAGKGSEASEKSWPFPIPQAEIDRSNGILTQHLNYQ